MSKLKKYWIEIVIIVGYLISDNLHMIIEYYNYSPTWYIPPWTGYEFNDSIFYLFHYFASLPLLMTFVLFKYSPDDVHKKWLRFLMLLASFRDFSGELLETLNINLTVFSNEGYNKTCHVKIIVLVTALLIPTKMKKMCLKLLKFISSA